jgi:hypothetical protein
MRIIREVQKDTMVYWAYTGADRDGQPTYAAPGQMTCRWDEAIKQVFAEDGSPVFSKIELITQSRLQPKGMIRKGTVASLTSPTVPKSNTGVHEVIMVEETPMLKTRSVTLFEAYA